MRRPPHQLAYAPARKVRTLRTRCSTRGTARPAWQRHPTHGFLPYHQHSRDARGHGAAEVAIWTVDDALISFLASHGFHPYHQHSWDARGHGAAEVAIWTVGDALVSFLASLGLQPREWSIHIQVVVMATCSRRVMARSSAARAELLRLTSRVFEGRAQVVRA